MILYHGTTLLAAEEIVKHGFKPDLVYNWGVKSKKGFVYLSKAYAPFYANMAKGGSMKALIKVEVDEDKLYPEDDFIMYAIGKPTYTQTDLDKINLEDYRHLTEKSILYMGNACAKPEDIQILGYKSFDDKMLIMICDPCISPLNYMVLGEYYTELTEYIYQNGTFEGFKKIGEWCTG